MVNLFFSFFSVDTSGNFWCLLLFIKMTPYLACTEDQLLILSAGQILELKLLHPSEHEASCSHAHC